MLRQLVSRTVRFQRLSSHIVRIPARRVSTQDQTIDSRSIQNLVPNPDNGLLNVTWDDGTTSRYPFVYLRDICQCAECFHDSSKQRAFDSVAGLANDLVASNVDIHLEGKQITLTWPNEHVSSFDSDWLFERRLLEEGEQEVDSASLLIEDGVQLWDNKMAGNIPSLLFHDVINKKSSQIEWLDMIGCHGVSVIKDAPAQPGQVQKLGETLGFLKEMWFGISHQTQSSIEENRENRATLVPQSVCPYDEYRGGLHLIHCQKHVEGPGGEHTFVDGFSIAKHLKDNDPKAFDLLSTSPIMYQRKVANEDAAFHMRFSRPIISLNSSGRLTRIIYNDSNRATFVQATPDEIPQLYRAYYKLSSIVRDPEYVIKHRLQPGDIMTYDCDRVFSGRNPFGPEVNGTEVMESAFTDKDMTNSRRRTLPGSLANEVD